MTASLVARALMLYLAFIAASILIVCGPWQAPRKEK